MKRPITGFGMDEEGDWFAFLGCGHRQHVRHKPPFIDRPWVTTEAGRRSRIGHELDCLRCDRLELPDSVVCSQTTGEFEGADLNEASSRSHAPGRHLWLRVIVTQGQLRLSIPELDVDTRVMTGEAGVIPPQTTHKLEQIGSVRFYLEMYEIPGPQMLPGHVGPSDGD